VDILAIEADRLGMDILDLAERWPEGQGETKLDSEQLLYSGGEQEGVGTPLSKRAAG
jgi:hypothetical protein